MRIKRKLRNKKSSPKGEVRKNAEHFLYPSGIFFKPQNGLNQLKARYEKMQSIFCIPLGYETILSNHLWLTKTLNAIICFRKLMSAKFFAFKSEKRAKNLGMAMIEYEWGESVLRKLKNIIFIDKKFQKNGLVLLLSIFAIIAITLVINSNKNLAKKHDK